MTFRMIGGRFRRHSYSLLWGAALLAVLALAFRWFVGQNVIGIVERRAHYLGPQEPGRIAALMVEVGDPVRRDQVLATLDVSDLIEGHSAAEMQRLRLQLENELADLMDRVSGLESREAQLATLNGQIERFRSAEQAGLGTIRDLHDLILQRDGLEAYLRNQRGESERLSRQAAGLRGEIQRLRSADMDSLSGIVPLRRSARAGGLAAGRALMESRIRMRSLVSPCDGVVTDINARPGDVVEDFDSLITVEERRPVYMTVYLPEKTSIRPDSGMSVRITSQRGRNYDTQGTVIFAAPGISRAPERLSFRGQLFWARKVRVALDSSHALLPGEVVSVHLSPEDR
ncbi:efflux RND transporter periplasmic adaptor subunit [bacterium]|nr:efflux RND transporter periplasmic adaptor subunit [bacterium]